MLKIERVNDTISVFVNGRLIWSGTIADWSKAIANAEVREIKGV